jgi:uncharacterized protein (TIGR03083 family)
VPTFPLEEAYRAERAAFLATLEGLDPDVFNDGPTLCDGWAPRDVLAHLLGIDDIRPVEYARGIGAGNAAAVRRFRDTSRDDLLALGRRWAATPSFASRSVAWFLLGDLSVHHQDVLRANGIAYDVPDASARAIYREGGVVLSGTRLATSKLVPNDGLARPLGVGRQVVRGSTVALGLWSARRPGLEAELVFS